MMTVKINKGVSIGKSTGLRKISVDDAEAAAAEIDGWLMLLTGGEKFVRSEGVLVNRVDAGVPITTLGSSNTTTGVIPNTTFPAIVTPLSGSVSDHEPGFDMNPDAFTFFAVIRLPSGNGSDQLVIPKTVPDDDTTQAPRIGFNTSGTFRIWSGDTSALLSHGVGDPDYYDQLVYVMASGSTTTGLTLRRNGVEVASAASWGGWDDPEFVLFEDFNGYIGDMGVLSKDLADPENATELAALDSWLMDKYGIS